MIRVKHELFGVTLTSTIGQPRPFAKESLDRIAVDAVNTFASLGLRPEHIRLRPGDILFDYELSFDLFNRNAIFKLGAQELQLSFQNGRDASDLSIILDCLARSHSLFNGSIEFSGHFLQAFSHVSLLDETKAEEWARFQGDGKRAEFEGHLAHISVDCWTDSIRFEVDRSMIFGKGLHFAWSTKIQGQIDGSQFPDALKAFEICANRFEFELVSSQT